MPGYEEEPPPGRVVFWAVPVAAILVAAGYMFLSAPGLRRLGGGGGVTATPRPAAAVSPTATPSATPLTSLWYRVPVYASGWRTGEPVEPPVAPEPNWRTRRDERTVAPVAWDAGPPSLEFLASDGASYRFRLDGLREGELLLLDRAELLSSIAGHPGVLPPATMSARPDAPTGIIIELTFDRTAPAVFGPTLQLAVRGSGGSVAFATAPYLHHGPPPSPDWARLGDYVEGHVIDSGFAFYPPTGMPEDAFIVWAGHGLRTGAVVWDWVVPRAGHWVSLVMVQGDRCEASQTRSVDCFAGVSAPAGPEEPVILGQRRWELSRAGAEWVIGTRLEGTNVLLLATDRDLLLRVAASIGQGRR